ncbi:hypothetical protein KPC_1283 [Acinetobacter stercoris]|uniref:DUF3298 domain-containing protein n=2 Tax=Acinetobacter stercoris TaxID=2126983 RepID=A0A2U3MXJ3_9GAMM|nr:hypothetical protein KPC_1283 [Acinetobacter stercoris]
MMLNSKTTLAFSVLVAAMTLSACQPKDSHKKEQTTSEASASEPLVTVLELKGNLEELTLKMPECDGKNCSEFSVERLQTNYNFVNDVIDKAILKDLDQILSISEQLKKEEAKKADSNKSAVEKQLTASSAVAENAPATAAQQLATQVQPYLDNFLNLDKELKTLGANHKISLSISPKILNSQGPLVTVVLNSSSYLGGAHGSTSQQYFNFDLKKEKQVELKDIVAPNQQAALENRAHEAFKIWVTDSKLADNVEQYEQAWKFKLSNNFYLGQQGLILQYAEYEIGPYVVGLPRLVIPYEQLQTILKKEYLPEVKADEAKAVASIDKPKS